MDNDRLADDQRVAREQALDRQEASLSASERALDARWGAQRKRVKVLGELADYVRDRERTLRQRAARLGLSEDAIDGLLPEPEAEVLDDPAEQLDAERLRLIETREALARDRMAFLDRWRAFLNDAEAGHSEREEALIAQEQALAEGFRRLVMHGRADAVVADVNDDRAWERAVEGAFQDDGLEVEVEALPEPAAPDWSGPAHAADVVSAEENRRRFERIAMEVAVDFGSPHNFYTGTADNISVGGLFVATRNLLPEGRRLTLRFSLPGTLRMEAEAEVAWRRLVADAGGPVGLGLRFLRVPDEARDEIERFVRQRLPMRA